MPTEPTNTIRKSTYDLALLIAGQVHAAQLTEEIEVYFLQNKGRVILALNRGFVLPEQRTPAVITTPVRTLDWWLAKTEEFSRMHLGVEINLRDRFVIPDEFPWSNVIPVFDPGTLNNRDAINKVTKALRIRIFEEVDVVNIDGSEASKEPKLHFIENSICPNSNSMNSSPDDLRATGKNYLRLRDYIFAMAVYHFATGRYLDYETFTRFPEDRLPNGNVMSGYWYKNDRSLRLSGSSTPNNRHHNGGARVVVPASRKP
jgi:hypothetical protein